MTPDDAVDALWRRLVTAPSVWGKYPEGRPHPLVTGAWRALGIILVPVGFSCFIVALVLVLAPIAVAYDASIALTALGARAVDRP